SSDLAIKVDNYLDDYRLVLNELNQKKFFDDDISPRRFVKIKRIYEKIFSMIDEPVRIIFFGPNSLSLYNKYSVIDLLVDEMRILRELVYKITEKVELILTTAEKEKEIEEKTEEKKSIELQEFIQERVESIEGGVTQVETVQEEARQGESTGVIHSKDVEREIVQKEETIPLLDFKETLDFKGVDVIGYSSDFANFPDTIAEPVDQNQKVINIL
ncbi:MAG: hypothetical protein ABDH37_09015, partial [Candidatus Hydrothermales bacterium]